MSCEAFGILISKWVDGEAKPEEASRVEGHIAGCAGCRKLAEEFRRNNGLVASAFGPEAFGQKVASNVLGRIAWRETLSRGGARLAAAAAILAVIVLWRSDRNRELETMQLQISASRAAVDRLEAIALAAMAREPEVRVETIREFVYIPERSTPRELPADGSTHTVVEGPLIPPTDELPPKRPWTMAMDRVEARADGDTGVVAVAWKMDRSPNAVYYICRRMMGEAEFGPALNEQPLVTPKFEDKTALGLSTYEYRVIAVAGTTVQVADEIARVTTPPDVRIEFKGLGKVEGRTSAVFGIRTRVDGRWTEETSWYPQPGDRHEATGLVFRNYDYARKTSTILTRVSEDGHTTLKPVPFTHSEALASVEAPGGAVQLWSGEAAAGSKARLELEAHQGAR